MLITTGVEQLQKTSVVVVEPLGLWLITKLGEIDDLWQDSGPFCARYFLV